ncbi:mono-functional DNA-alkylating methyl methanesulfonate N-term-domain-containing protein [Chaetomium strumarium]|uniref:Mono-functional DNA-alkylating methyl methanesulfonate N-term-domain-containing protein n=1 Tax=Chaetomium strumarium TaxID=1170767 RepID=A0AAJ0GUX7_9PEZI|nr:mono-functional DNA-alkylating methyl methanesulfonate N-term-domain-containing protein [Chaetomium strumarium]
MAFQTSVLRGGEWVTETVNLQAVLGAQKQDPKAPTMHDAPKPPRCGLLTRSVVESALANWILPVRLRSPEYNDVAFIGDRFVQICELRKDGRLKDIARKSDFGCRIRNACVIGSPAIADSDMESNELPSSLPVVKAEDDDPDLLGVSSSRRTDAVGRLPPQLLMLVLENGDSVFLFARSGPDREPEFVTSCFGRPFCELTYLGFHLAVDPSSRYVVLANPTEYFAVYELDSLTEVDGRYSRNEVLNPVNSWRCRSVRGVIHKVAFLHPRPEDPHHIILLLVVARHGKSRTVIYEWELGDDLTEVFAEEKQGHRLPVEHQVPLLLIPLTVQSAFIAVSPDQIALCTECLHGPPRFEPVAIPARPPTANHRGRHQPLWTAWARPFRRSGYNVNRDCIYLAREDGVITFLEAHEDGSAGLIFNMDPFPCAISRAFACMPNSDRSTDVLILGSDVGPGGCWKIPARQPAELLGILPNWSPVVDLTSTDEYSGWCQDASQDKAMVPWQHATWRQPDRVFGTGESASKGAITEYRYGLKADIALDLEYGPGVKQAWLLPAHSGYLLLLSMPDCSAALNLASDFSSATAAAPDTIPYDLASTTLVLGCDGDLTVQITREKVVLVAQHRSASFSFQTLPGILNASVSDAYARGDCVVVSTHTNAKFRIHVYKIDPGKLTLSHVQTIDVDGEVSCLSLDASYNLFAGIRKASQTLLGRGSLQQSCTDLQRVNLAGDLPDQEASFSYGSPSLLEGVESIVSIGDTVLLGTRSGEVFTVRNPAGSLSIIGREKYGSSVATLTCSRRDGASDPTILVCCDGNLVSLSLGQHGSRRCRVWPVDASRLEAPAPMVQYAAVVDLPCEDGATPILMISGSRLLLAEMREKPGPANRIIPVDGSPNRVMYCQSTQCLVVAVNRDYGPTLVFLNPDTGEDIGRPTDKTGEPQTCIAGLGRAGDRVMGLAEWRYKRDGNVWNFILVITKAGRLILVSTQKMGTREGGSPAIRYWTRFRKDVKEPIYSILSYDEGLVYCFARTIQWEVLDLQERKLKPVKSFELGSPATALRISNGKLVALTSAESLVVLDHFHAEADKIRLCHVDPWRRNGVDFFESTGPDLNDASGGIFLVADRDCSVTGLWVPWQIPDKECEVVVEAELPSSIRRFRRVRTRPMWERGQRRGPRYGRLPATVDDAEVLGVSLNGAMYHFTLLSVEAWRLLRFIQNMALAIPEASPAQRDRSAVNKEIEPVRPPPEMHVDGDILRRCLEKRTLEQLVATQGQLPRLLELLGELDGGQHVVDFSEGEPSRYFQLAYDVLEYYLSPVL